MKLLAYLLIIMIVAAVLLFLVWLVALSIAVADWLAEATGVGNTSSIYGSFKHDRDSLIGTVEIGLIIAFVAMVIAVFAYSRRR